MNIVPFDTLKLARRLETAGFSRDQATGAAEALAETFSSEIATKGDLQEQRLALKGDMDEFRTEMRTEFAKVRAELGDVRTEMRTEFADVRTEVRTEFAKVRTEIANGTRTTTQWIVGAVFVNVVALLGALAAVWQMAHR